SFGQPAAHTADRTPRSSGEFKKPCDSPPQSGMKSIAVNRQRAERLGLNQAFSQFDQAFRQRGGAVGDKQTCFVRSGLARELELPFGPPNQGMPPKQRSDNLGNAMPERITRRQMGQFVKQHYLALRNINVVRKSLR